MLLAKCSLVLCHGVRSCQATHVCIQYVKWQSLFQKIQKHLAGEGLKHVIFTNCIKDENIKQVGLFLLMFLLHDVIL